MNRCITILRENPGPVFIDSLQPGPLHLVPIRREKSVLGLNTQGVVSMKGRRKQRNVTIQEALSLAEQNIKANFGNSIPDASLATVQYLHWIQSLNLWARIKHLELLEERNNLSRESLLLIDPLLTDKEQEEELYYVHKEG